MKQFIFFLIFISLFSCKSSNEVIPGVRPMNPPGLQTMKKYGKKLTPAEILKLSGDIMKEMGIFGAAAYYEYAGKLNSRNYQYIYMIDSIKFNKDGFAEHITGRLEKPATYMEFVAGGGLGIPVYEAASVNELGVVFGRRANMAVREGVIVRINPLEYSDIYYLKIGSETYDAIMNASVLFQAYEMVRIPYIENLRVELEGMIMNSESRDVILKDMKEFIENNKNKYSNDSDVMIAFMNANESYLEMLAASNKEAMERIEKSKEFLDMIKKASDTASARVALIFAEIAKDIALITLHTAANVLQSDKDPISLTLAGIEAALITAQKTAEYAARNIPSNSKLKFEDLENIRAYNRYQHNRYLEMVRINNQAERDIDKIIRVMKRGGAL